MLRQVLPLLLSLAPVAASATLVTGLDNISVSSTFDVGATTALPANGWDNLQDAGHPGAARMFSTTDGSLIGTAQFTNYQVYYATSVDLAADTQYTFEVQLGYAGGGGSGTEATTTIAIGTWDGANFSTLASATPTIVYQGNMSSGGHQTFNVMYTSPSIVTSGQTLAVLFSQDAPSNTHDYFGMANATLDATAVPEPSTYAALLGLGALGFAAVRRRRP